MANTIIIEPISFRPFGIIFNFINRGHFFERVFGDFAVLTAFVARAVRDRAAGYAVVVFAILWGGFAIALIANRAWLDLLWNWVRALPTVAQVIVWVVFLPVMVVLWIWASSWPAIVSLLAFTGVVVWTLLAVYSFLQALR